MMTNESTPIENKIMKQNQISGFHTICGLQLLARVVCLYLDSDTSECVMELLHIYGYRSIYITDYDLFY